MLKLPHASKVMLKILQTRLQQHGNRELPDIQAPTSVPSSVNLRGTYDSGCIARGHPWAGSCIPSWASSPGLLFRLCRRSLSCRHKNSVLFACNLHVPCFYLVVGKFPPFSLHIGTTKPPVSPLLLLSPVSFPVKVQMKRPLGNIWLPDVF